MELTAFPIHFEDRSGTEFERLVFVYAVREKDWDSIEWLGQTGKDGGRDIWVKLTVKRFVTYAPITKTLPIKKQRKTLIN